MSDRNTSPAFASGSPVVPDTAAISEHMALLLNYDYPAALRWIAALEADRRRIELIDDPGLAPNLHIDADDEGEFCWKLGDDDRCYATVRQALDSIGEEDADV